MLRAFWGDRSRQDGPVCSRQDGPTHRHRTPSFPRYAGGSGKTTMAVRLYNRLSQAFPKRAIVRLEADDAQGKETQRHLVSALKQLGATGVNEAADPAELITRLRDLMGAGRVLLCVDNALTATQLDGLLPSGLLTSLQPGSRLIVTSRFAELQDSASYWVSGWHCRSCWVSQGTATRHTSRPLAFALNPALRFARRPCRPSSWSASSTC
jgi:hypothetical protein